MNCSNPKTQKYCGVIRARAPMQACNFIKEAAAVEGCGLAEYVRRAVADRVVAQLDKMLTDASKRISANG